MMKHTFILFILFIGLCRGREGYAEKKSIGIYTYMVAGSPSWDPDSIKAGITGSEEAVIYISKELADLGHQVIVFGNPPPDSVHSKAEANPRYIPFYSSLPSKLDVGIAWRMPDKAEIIKASAHAVYLWPHDTFHSQLTQAQIDGFTDVLWLSEWQRKQWISENPPFAKYTHIFGNGISPSQFQPISERANPYSCIYGSNYARGLELMLDLWPAIKKQFPKATLDIYYGWQHWGLLTPTQEAKMRAQIVLLQPSGVTEHGLVSHEELNRAYEKASLWTYPCIAPETFCITALRAQLAGAIPVIINGTALEETVRSGYYCANSNEYLALVTKAMEQAEQMTLNKRKEMGDFVLSEFTWKAIAEKWVQLFDTHATPVAPVEVAEEVETAHAQ